MEEPEIVNVVFSRRHADAPQALADAIADPDLRSKVKEIEEVDSVIYKQLSLYNPSANLLVRPKPASFEAMREINSSDGSMLWLTEGLTEGKYASAALAQGLLDVAREGTTKDVGAVLTRCRPKRDSRLRRQEFFAASLAPNNHAAGPAEQRYW